MRTPVRLLAITILVFIFLTLFLSRIHQDDLKGALSKFQQSRPSWSYQSAKGYSTTSPSDKTVGRPPEDTLSDPSSASAPLTESQKSAAKDADRGFTDKEQAVALKKLEQGYGDKLQASDSRTTNSGQSFDPLTGDRAVKSEVEALHEAGVEASRSGKTASSSGGGDGSVAGGGYDANTGLGSNSGSGYTTNNGEHVDEYGSKNGGVFGGISGTTSQTDEDRDAQRGFTEKEQAAAIAKLETEGEEHGNAQPTWRAKKGKATSTAEGESEATDKASTKSGGKAGRKRLGMVKKIKTSPSSEAPEKETEDELDDGHAASGPGPAHAGSKGKSNDDEEEVETKSSSSSSKKGKPKDTGDDETPSSPTDEKISTGSSSFGTDSKKDKADASSRSDASSSASDGKDKNTKKPTGAKFRYGTGSSSFENLKQYLKSSGTGASSALDDKTSDPSLNDKSSKSSDPSSSKSNSKSASDPKSDPASEKSGSSKQQAQGSSVTKPESNMDGALSHLFQKGKPKPTPDHSKVKGNDDRGNGKKWYKRRVRDSRRWERSS